MFASRSLAWHLARGAVGLGGLGATLLLTTTHPFISMGLLVPSMVALRGCPMCWTVGLVQTVAARLRGRSAVSIRACPVGRRR